MLEKALSALSCIHFGKTKYDEPMLRVFIAHAALRLGFHTWKGPVKWFDRVINVSPEVQLNRPYIIIKNLLLYVTNGFDYSHQRMYSAATVSEEFTSHYSRLLSTPVVGPVDELFELYAGISSLFNKVERTPILNNETAEEMMSACLVQRDKVVKWYLDRGEILGEFPHCCSPESLPCDGLPKSDKIFGLPYMFSDLDTMCNYVLYWTACLLIELLIYGVSTSIMALGRGRRQSNFAMRHIEYCLIAEQYADNFVRSLPFCLQTGMNAWGANVIIASMKHVYKPYVALRREEKFQWCQKALQVMSDRGMSLAEVVSNAGQDVWDHYEPPSLIRKTNVHPQDIAALPIAPNELSPDSRSSNDSAQGSPPRPPISVLGNKRKSGIITCHETSTDSPFE
ncbi:uncharacterized protein N7483_000005 [Penicillium malachiteum]|uniref:uncharacterized protein n=1 Tax=Penicillium malachiteum TaxID=1324776 RepID=UPI002549B7AB|nr:uncharacterized protein N7483_000005 [Penicillium malachiteum]KAJ5734880.1 hypothetical protein N7483_000005 [Penicillium malachiteum]